MNCEVCQLKELVLEPLEIREVLRCVLHTIAFHRALGLVRPKDVDCELFEITYVKKISSQKLREVSYGCTWKNENSKSLRAYYDDILSVLFLKYEYLVHCGDAELDKKIEEKIDQFMVWVEKHPNRKCQVSLSFYEVKNKQPTWFSNRIERLCWEQWYINLHVVTPKTHGKSHHSKVPVNSEVDELKESSSRRAALEDSLREVLFHIIKFVNDKKDHIPPIPNNEVISFPYEITIPSSSESSFAWHTDVLKRMLQTSHPSMLS